MDMTRVHHGHDTTLSGYVADVTGYFSNYVIIFTIVGHIVVTLGGIGDSWKNMARTN